MPLDMQDKKRLRSIGHGLKPVVTVASKGLTENVTEEIRRALGDHELIKVSLRVGDRDAKKQTTEAICENLGAELVQAIGHVILIYKPADKPNPRLSNLLR